MKSVDLVNEALLFVGLFGELLSVAIANIFATTPWGAFLGSTDLPLVAGGGPGDLLFASKEDRRSATFPAGTTGGTDFGRVTAAAPGGLGQDRGAAAAGGVGTRPRV